MYATTDQTQLRGSNFILYNTAIQGTILQPRYNSYTTLW